MNSVSAALLQRAQARDDISAEADVDLTCKVILSLISCRTQILFQLFDKAYYEKMFDGILLPVLRGPQP